MVSYLKCHCVNIIGVCQKMYFGQSCLFMTITLACCFLVGCSYVDQARRASDVAVEVAQQGTMQAVIEANIERQRVRRLRCLSPLLTPATISGAAMDPRLGRPWVDELMRDCPAFSAFIAETALSRARAAITAPAASKTSAQE